jgi:hypothetical protein
MFPEVYVWDDEANNLTEVVGKDLESWRGDAYV